MLQTFLFEDSPHSHLRQKLFAWPFCPFSLTVSNLLEICSLGRVCRPRPRREHSRVNTAVINSPQTLQETGVHRPLLEGLALKTLHMETELTLLDLAQKMKLSLGVIEEIFLRLRKDQFCEVKGLTAGVHRIAITSQGRERAMALMQLSQYVGPAPVSLEQYTARTRSQSVRNHEVHPPEVERALAHLVLDAETLKQLGTAVVSGTSIFLYGPPGTGKTTVAAALPRIYNDAVWIPYAVEVDSQIIAVFDSGLHEHVDSPAPGEFDERWVLCRRPCVSVGGELTIEMLDLQFNSLSRYYSAPLQMKANNGVLVVDDFGRQRIRPEELLNRWIVPLDRSVDFLTLTGGKKFDLPFDLFVVFATNLDPTTLADEAFLRRIQNKVRLDSVTPAQFHLIARHVCEDLGLTYDPQVVDHLIQLLSGELKQELRPCYPRDVFRQIVWGATYQGHPPRLDLSTVNQACRNYFLSAAG